MNYFEVKVKYDKTQEDGMQKKVTETYLVDALSFSECEDRIIDEMKVYISGEFEVNAIQKAKYNELVESVDTSADKWYKCKLLFITLDEKTEKEKKSAVHYLVQGSSLENAKNNMVKFMSTSSIDYEFVEIKETPIMDVLHHKVGNSSNDVLENTQSNV